MTNLTKEEQKQVFKQAIREWLDEQFLAFGKWSAGAIAAMAFVALLYFILKASGWSAVREALQH